MRYSLLSLILAAACHTGPTAPTPPSARPAAAKPAPAEEDIPVASIANPDVIHDGAAERIGEVFKQQGIKWLAYGSLGYTVSVPASQAERARSLLRGMANVYVIEACELAQLMAPPVALAPQFMIERVDLDGALANLGTLVAGTDVQWNHPSGILVRHVGAGSLFERMGWLAGDFIVEVDGTAVRSEADAARVLAKAKASDKLAIVMNRKGTPMKMQVLVTRMP
jgi:PDZ domain